MGTFTRKDGAVAVAAVLAAVTIAACSAAGSPPTSPAASSAASTQAKPVVRPDPEVCRAEARDLMRAALAKHDRIDSLPKLPDRSLGLESCQGLTEAEKDRIALLLQNDLQTDMLAAAPRRSKTAS